MYDEEGELYQSQEHFGQPRENFDGSQHQYHMDDEENYDDMDENDDENYDDEEAMLDSHPDSTVTCNICERVLPSVKVLKQHIHDVHRAVVCDICWRPFLSNSELDIHMKTHQGEAAKEPERKDPTPARATSSTSNMAFKCGVCGCSYEVRRAMVEHLKASHEFLGCFTCMLCGEFFPNKPTFTIHRKLSHIEAKEVTCQSCGVGLKQHEYDQHQKECECGGIDIKEAEWEGRKEGKAEKD